MNDLMNKTFMYLGIEYRIIYINEKKKRLNVEPVNEIKTFPRIGQRIEIERIPFTVTYIHEGKKSITLTPLVPDDLLNNNKESIVNESK